MSDSIHDEDDLPTLGEVAQACEYLIEPDVVNSITGQGGYNWTLRQMSGALFDTGNVDTYEAAQTAVREAFKRLRDQDTAIISIAERREMRNVRREIDLPGLLDSYDWEEVFGEGSGGNCDGTIQVVPPGDSVASSPVSRAMVVEIVAAVNGENDGDSWVGVFRLNDGRYLVAEGGCDYTGWDCQASNSLCVAGSLENSIRYGLNPEQQERLGLAVSK